MNSQDPQRFENYRRERNRRRLDRGPVRDLGPNARVLREIEEAEAREVRNERLTREVQEFFEGATRAAASIVSQVAEAAEQEQQVHVTQEMSEFLTATIQRAQQFVEQMKSGAASGNAPSLQDIEPHMRNLVGHKLDEFRFEGTADVADQHIGLDPFLVEPNGEPVFDGEPSHAESSPQASTPQSFDHLPMPDMAEEVKEVALPVDEHPLAELVADEDPLDDPLLDVAQPAAVQWFERLASSDPEQLKTALKALVHYGAMTRDEARAVYQETGV